MGMESISRVTAAQSYQANAAASQPAPVTNVETCNLKAPIIVNMDTMKGTQLIAGNEDYQVRFPIYDILDAKKQKDGE